MENLVLPLQIILWSAIVFGAARFIIKAIEFIRLIVDRSYWERKLKRTLKENKEKK